MDITEIAEASVRPSRVQSTLAAGGVSIHSFRTALSTEVIDAVRVVMQPPRSFRSAFRRVQAHELVLDRDNIHVQLIDSNLARRAVLPRCWTRLTLVEPAAAGARSQLVLEHRGETVELGEFLAETPRRLLAEWLQRLIGPMGDSPALSTALGYVPEDDVRRVQQLDRR